jgi:hypothetical protein
MHTSSRSGAPDRPAEAEPAADTSFHHLLRACAERRDALDAAAREHVRLLGEAEQRAELLASQVLDEARQTAALIIAGAREHAAQITRTARAELRSLTEQIDDVRAEIERQRDILPIGEPDPPLHASSDEPLDPLPLAQFPATGTLCRAEEPPASKPDGVANVLYLSPTLQQPSSDLFGPAATAQTAVLDCDQRPDSPPSWGRRAAVGALTTIAAAAIAVVVAVNLGTPRVQQRSRPSPRGTVKIQPVPEAGGFEEAATPVPGTIASVPGTVTSVPGTIASVPGTVTSVPDTEATRLSIHVAAHRVAWVWFAIDGAKQRAFLMSSGQTRDLSARDSIVIHSGDAGALLLTVDGASPQPLGRNGAVLTREYKAGAAPDVDQADPPRARTTPPAPAPLPAPVATTPLPEPVPIDTPAPVAFDAAQRGPALPAPALHEPLASPRNEIVRLHELWLAARSRGDYATMQQISAPDFDLLDERTEPGPPDTERRAITGLADMHVDIWGDGAVLSGRIVGNPVGTSGRTSDSYVSEVWVRRSGQWRLLGVRLADSPKPRLMTTGR